MRTRPQHDWIVRLVGWFRRAIVVVIVRFLFRVTAAAAFLRPQGLKMEWLFGAHGNVQHAVEPAARSERSLLQCLFGARMVRAPLHHGTLKGSMQSSATAAAAALGRRGREKDAGTSGNALYHNRLARAK